MAEWSKACDSSESLPAQQVSHGRQPAGVRIPFLSSFDSCFISLVALERIVSGPLDASSF